MASTATGPGPRFVRPKTSRGTGFESEAAFTDVRVQAVIGNDYTPLFLGADSITRKSFGIRIFAFESGLQTNSAKRWAFVLFA
jgi:hypothetical protein